ncbi:hypothetical protein THF1C08_100069 [Vibrio jasicida]|uniref:DUF4375 domain-containing protein n=1 Tax=Vibrio jasicida TaxID=766224 RepID=A0AAU9R1N6_9VIBR|nr:hypothetical protein THF1C08_100069 [Vibrio jasicida]CAH1603965.1 hypothetical protein THF1A12_90069 [Vibrio jasicida]
MSYYIIEDKRIVLSNTENALQHYTNSANDECFEIKPEDIPQLLFLKRSIYNLDWETYIYLDGKANKQRHWIESNDHSFILDFVDDKFYEPVFLFKAINGQTYYTNNIGSYDYEQYRVLNLSKDELLRIWLKVEKGQSFDDFIQDALYYKTFVLEEELESNRITDFPSDDAIYIDDEYFELLENGYYTEFLEELLEIDLEELITNKE